MDFFLSTLISPVVLCFVLGMAARRVRSDLEIPDAVFQACSIYLLLAIGLKGGSALSQTSVQAIANPVRMALLLGVLTPFSAFVLLKWFAKLNRINAAATAAHYGSVSAVTFLASMEAAKIAGWQPEGYLPALVAILEVPGILIGLCLAQEGGTSGQLKRAIHEVLTGKSMVLLCGGLLIGWSSLAQGRSRRPDSRGWSHGLHDVRRGRRRFAGRPSG